MTNSNLFFRAWAIKKQNPQFTFRKALISSWKAEKLTREMAEGNIVEFVYIKLDGTVRIAKGTIPEFKGQGKEKTVGQNSVVNYFDIDAEGWRSFKAVQLATKF